MVMKKRLFFFAFILATAVGARAQDTVELWDVRDLEGYYIPSEWPSFPDDFTYDESLKKYLVYIQFYLQNRRQMSEWGYRVLTDDSMEVYGLAAIMCPGNTMKVWLGMDLPSDTSSQYSDTWLMLFAAEPDSLRPLADTSYTYIDGWQTPEHYVKFGWWNIYGLYEYPPLPLFERYFPMPVTVVDSFYVGYTVPRGHATPPSDITFPFVITADLLDSPDTDTVRYFERTHWKYYSTMLGSNQDYWVACWSSGPWGEHPLIFPILTPPDTTTPPSDTTGVGLRQNDLIYRYTTLQPNPATDRVRVLSSFGITAIEAYDPRGRLVYTNTFKHSHIHTFSLDVSSWPRGTYLLRIQTPAGPTTKKLLIQ